MPYSEFTRAVARPPRVAVWYEHARLHGGSVVGKGVRAPCARARALRVAAEELPAGERREVLRRPRLLLARRGLAAGAEGREHELDRAPEAREEERRALRGLGHERRRGVVEEEVGQGHEGQVGQERRLVVRIEPGEVGRQRRRLRVRRVERLVERRRRLVRVRRRAGLDDGLERAVGEQRVVVVVGRRDGRLLLLLLRQRVERRRRRALGLVRREEVALVERRQPRDDADEAPEGRELVGVLAGRRGVGLGTGVGADVLEGGREKGVAIFGCGKRFVRPGAWRLLAPRTALSVVSPPRTARFLLQVAPGASELFHGHLTPLPWGYAALFFLASMQQTARINFVLCRHGPGLGGGGCRRRAEGPPVPCPTPPCFCGGSRERQPPSASQRLEQLVLKRGAEVARGAAGPASRHTVQAANRAAHDGRGITRCPPNSRT